MITNKKGTKVKVESVRKIKDIRAISKLLRGKRSRQKALKKTNENRG